jgi:FkbM family methyltransferase
MTNNLLVSKNNVSFTVEDSKELHQDIGYNFWSEKYSSWEPGTFNFLDRFLSKDKDYLDIGSWIGPTAIYGSFFSRNVVAVEPDPIAHKILQKNISLNSIKNINVIHKAASGVKEVYLQSNNFLGDSMTRVSEKNTTGISAETIGLDALLSMGDFSLIKIDIEGHEFSLINHYAEILQDYKIPLLLSLHGPFFTNGDALTSQLVKDLDKVNNILTENGEQISNKDITSNFGSYLFTW